MAIQKVIRIMTWAMSDGTTTSFTVKLAKDGDPYWIGTAQEGSVRGSFLQNWFADNIAAATPKGVKVVAGAVSATIAVPTSTLTVTVQPKPKDAIMEVVIDLLFS